MLRQSENRYRQLFLNMNRGATVLRAMAEGNDFVLVDINQAAERIEKIDREDYLGKSVTSLFPDCKSSGLLDIFQQVWKNGHSISYPVSLYWEEWIQSWRNNYVYRLSPQEIVVIYDDVTEKKRSEQTLRKEHDLLLTVLAQTPDLIALKDTNLVYTLVNKNFSEFFGKKPEQIVGNNDYALLAAAEATAQHYHDARVITSGHSQIKEEEVSSPAGGTKWLQVEKTPFFEKQSGSCRGLLYTVRDITRQRRAEEALRDSEERYKRLVEGSPDILYIYSLQRGFIFVSARLESILGYWPEDVSAQPFLLHECIHPDDQPAVARAFAATRHGHGFDLEYRICDVHGTWHWFHDRHIDITTTAGETIVEGLASDITARKEIEEKLKRSYEQLEDAVAERTNELLHSYQLLLHAEKLSSLGKLAASIAHEFGSPVFGIRNFLTGLPKRAPLAASDLKLIELAVRECDRIKELIDGLRGFRRPSSSGATKVNIHGIIDNILLLCQRNFQKKKILVEKHYGADPPHIFVIEDQIKQVILNFLDNAQEAIPASGGVIKIASGLREQRLTLSIQDSGKGMNEEMLQRVFEPFVSTKTESGGIGLGMSISAEIITAHGGEIEVQSTPGQGTTFTILLPNDKSHSIACGWDE